MSIRLAPALNWPPNKQVDGVLRIFPRLIRKQSAAMITRRRDGDNNALFNARCVSWRSSLRSQPSRPSFLIEFRAEVLLCGFK